MTRLNDATPQEWDSTHRAMYKQKELTFAEHQAARAMDVQVGGNHYKDMAIQPVEFSIKNGLGFCEGNVIKYICRYNNKGGRQDLLKAKHYIDLLLENADVSNN